MPAEAGAVVAAEAIYAAALAVRQRNCRACAADLRTCDCTPDVDEMADAATALLAAKPFLAAAELTRIQAILATEIKRIAWAYDEGPANRALDELEANLADLLRAQP